MKFRRKPVVIEATQWFRNGDHPLDYAIDHQWPDDNGEEVVQVGDTKMRATTYTGAFRKKNDWEGDVVRYFRCYPGVSGDTICQDCGRTMHDHGWIDSVNTLNPSGCTVCPGDWVLTETSDPTKYYPCKPGTFAERHTPYETHACDTSHHLEVAINALKQSVQTATDPGSGMPRDWMDAAEKRKELAKTALDAINTIYEELNKTPKKP